MGQKRAHITDRSFPLFFVLLLLPEAERRSTVERGRKKNVSERTRDEETGQQPPESSRSSLFTAGICDIQNDAYNGWTVNQTSTTTNAGNILPVWQAWHGMGCRLGSLGGQVKDSGITNEMAG
jgi:hypothetical protein